MGNPGRTLRLAIVASALLLGSVRGVAQEGAVPARYFGFRYENDFFNATDQYFTQGVQFTYAAPFVARSPLSRILLRPKDAVMEDALLLEQQCYTPTSIRRDTIFTGDRPFAAALFLGQRAVAMDDSRGLRLSSTISIGVLGPCAVCAEEQRGIHDALDNIEPLGWEFQVSNALLLNYAAVVEKRVVDLPFLETSVGPLAEVGTYRTNAGLMAHLEMGSFFSRFAQRPQRDHRFHISAFGEAIGKLVAYDATLQGGFFSGESPYTLRADELTRTVLRGTFGLRASFGRMEITASRTFITREFEHGRDHGWGGFLLTYRW